MVSGGIYSCGYIYSSVFCFYLLIHYTIGLFEYCELPKVYFVKRNFVRNGS